MKNLDFMIIGAQKSGTTALAYFCSQHPQLTMASEKEPHIFDDPDFDANKVSQQYELFFQGSSEGQVLGEATPIYMYLPEIPERLSEYNPRLKLVVVLRDPVERAISHYCMERNRGNENMPFLAAVLLEPVRCWLAGKDRSERSSVRAHSYFDRGNYKVQLDRLSQQFGSDQLLILDFRELSERQDQCLKKVFRFLNVNDEIKIAPGHIFPTANRVVPRWTVWLLKLIFFKPVASYRALVEGSK